MKYKWIFLICILSSNLFATQSKPETKKEEGSVSIPLKSESSPNLGLQGFGFGMGTFDGDFGIQVRKDFMLGPKKISVLALQGGLFFRDETTFNVDVDYHHIFTPNSAFRFYPLAGIDLAIEKEENRFGINLGVGANIKVTEQTALFVEAKYVFSDWEGFGFIIGVNF